ncbi:MAG: hypothetical protein ACK5ZG_02840 [Phycisphaerae bacterium]|jgi:hypothetical protein
MNLRPSGPDMLSSEQTADAIASPRRLRWWAPAMWLYILSMTLAAFGVWTWVDAEADLRLASTPQLTAGYGTITHIDNNNSRITRYGGVFSLRYQFEVGSLTYAGTRVSPYDGLTTANAQSIRQYLTLGATVPIKYIATDPAKSFIDAAAWCNLSEEAAATRQSRVIGIVLVIAALAAFIASAWTFFTAQARRQLEHDFQLPS